MKYYYNGRLVRTSKTHIYTHALVGTSGKAVACSSDPNRLMKEKELGIKNWESYLKSVEAKGNTEDIEYAKAYLEKVRNWKIVEIEMREE